MAQEHLTIEPQCEGCGARPEVYGSSWCGRCDANLPSYAQDRIIKLRNACLFYSNVMGNSRSMDRRILVQDAGATAREALRHGK